MIALRHICPTLAALCASALCASCECTEQEYPAAPPGRTVLAYLAADNDLSGEASEKIEALRRGRAAGSCGELLIYTDRPSGACLLHVTSGGSVETVAEYGTENSVSPDVLRRVLREVKAAYPADGYGLLFFSHASGWMPYGTLQSPSRSLGRDDRPGGETLSGGSHAEMELAEFAAALSDGGLDFIVFEACLMAGVETAYALRAKADYMLASPAEMLSPGFTPIYERSLGSLLDASCPATEALESFGRTYMAHISAQEGIMRSATLSLVDLSQMDALARSAAGMLPTDPAPVEDLQRFDRPGKYGDTPALARYFDLGAAAERFAAPSAVADFLAQLQLAVPWKEATERFMLSDSGSGDALYNGFDIVSYSGLTVYIPREGLDRLNDAYRDTEWYAATAISEADDFPMQNLKIPNI